MGGGRFRVVAIGKKGPGGGKSAIWKRRAQLLSRARRQKHRVACDSYESATSGRLADVATEAPPLAVRLAVATEAPCMVRWLRERWLECGTLRLRVTALLPRQSQNCAWLWS